MNIVFIVSDTFRRDHLGCYGNDWIWTPNLDKLAEKSVIFDNAYAASFPTVPMRGDIFTGKLSFTYLGWNPLPPTERTLAQILTQAGYNTMGVVDPPFFLRDGFGYDRGFADFQWIRGQKPSLVESADTLHERRYKEDYFVAKTMSAAERWLERHHSEKFFLYVDTWDPHEPWDPPSWYVERYLPGYDGRVVEPCYWYWEEKGYTEEDIEIVKACYAGKVSLVDRWIGSLLEKIELMGLMENTAIIFTSDHGHYFGEHGQLGKALVKDYTHGEWDRGEFMRSPIYREVARVPLVIYSPRLEPRRIENLVSHPDLMPTILEIADTPRPNGIHGRSFVPLLQGETTEHRDFVVTSSFLGSLPGKSTKDVFGTRRRQAEHVASTVTTPGWSLIYSGHDQPIELYDTRSDPGQTKNVFEQNRQIAGDLHSKYLALLNEVGTKQEYLASRQHL